MIFLGFFINFLKISPVSFIPFAASSPPNIPIISPDNSSANSFAKEPIFPLKIPFRWSLISSADGILLLCDPSSPSTSGLFAANCSAIFENIFVKSSIFGTSVCPINPLFSAPSAPSVPLAPLCPSDTTVGSVPPVPSVPSVSMDLKKLPKDCIVSFNLPCSSSSSMPSKILAASPKSAFSLIDDIIVMRTSCKYFHKVCLIVGVILSHENSILNSTLGKNWVGVVFSGSNISSF